MSRRRVRTASAAAICLLMAGGAAAWTLAPAKAHADAPKIVQSAPVVDIWAKGPVDRDNMVQGVLDYRSDPAGH